MVRKLLGDTFYRIRDPRNFHAAMRADVNLLHSNQAYLSLTTVLVCCLDALAAGSGEATRGKFEAFVKQQLPNLCAALETACPGKEGAAVLYEPSGMVSRTCVDRNGGLQSPMIRSWGVTGLTGSRSTDSNSLPSTSTDWRASS
jgi:hypothetical protein